MSKQVQSVGGQGKRPIIPPVKLTFDQLGCPIDLQSPMPMPRVAVIPNEDNHLIPPRVRRNSNESITSRSSLTKKALIDANADKEIAALQREVIDAQNDLEIEQVHLESVLDAIAQTKSKNIESGLPEEAWSPSSQQFLQQSELTLANLNLSTSVKQKKIQKLEQQLQDKKKRIQEAAAREKRILDLEEQEAASQYISASEDGDEEGNNKIGSDVFDFDQPFQHAQFNQYEAPKEDKDTLLIQMMQAQLHLMQQRQTPQPIVISTGDKDLPIFSGKAEDWPIFHGEYSRTSKRYDAVENARRLQRCLKGAARDAVVGLIDEPKNVERIIETLKHRFGRPEFIIDSLIEKVKQLKSPDLGKPESFINFGTAVQHLVARVESLNEPGYLYDKSLLQLLVRKLPIQSAEQWIQWISDRDHLPKNLKSFSTWLDVKVRVCEQLYTPRVVDDPEIKASRTNSRRGNVSSAVVNKREDKCPVCEKGNHKVESCFSFKKMKISERWEKVNQRGNPLCLCCLEPNHSIRDCKKKVQCEKDGCTRFHHPLLHKSPTEKRNDVNADRGNSVAESIQPSSSSVATAVTSTSLPIIPVRISGPYGSEVINALLDTGANVNLIEANVADRLGLNGPTAPLNFTVYGQDVREEQKSKVLELSISGCYRNAPVFSVSQVRTVKKLGIPGITLDVEELKQKHPYLRRCRARSISQAKPEMIIGWKSSKLFAPREILEDSSINSPVAYRSHLGWYLCTDGDGVLACSFASLIQDDKIETLVKQHFQLENAGVQRADSLRSKEDIRALKQMELSTCRKADRWETGLLWKNPDEELPYSKTMALRRLYGMERKMDRDSKFAELVKDKFDDYIKKGYLKEKLNPQPAKTSKEWYLPWFFSYHPTKKPRLVFDAAAKHQNNGKCFNDFVLKGPPLLRHLAAVLIRFRRYQIAITGDIKEMFHQVALREEDWPSQRILYREMDRKSPPRVFEMTVLFFGSASSPASAIYVKNRNASEFVNQYPKAVHTIHFDEYMDDHLSGADTVQEAIQMRREVTEIHAKGGFPIVKWNSNSPEVLSTIPDKEKQTGLISFDSKDLVQFEKTLGLWWNPKEDVFQFQVSMQKLPEDVKSGNRPPTKREVLSFIMSLFDPLGFLAPLKMKSMSIIQNTWKLQIGWDDPLKSDVLDEWNSWINQLCSVEGVTIPRKYSSCPLRTADSIQLHVFCDAGEEAYSAVVYLRTVTGGRVEVSFVMGKCRIAPIRGQTIPKLELEAAKMGTRLYKFVSEALNEEVKVDSVYFWTDSRTVLCQLRAETTRHKAFVANRVNEILDTTELSSWRWIPTSLNPADDGTRSHKIDEFSSACRWLVGPQFLLLPESEWPQEPKISSVTEEVEENCVMAATTTDVKEESDFRRVLPQLQKFSSWMHLIRVTATVKLACRQFLAFRKTGKDVNEDQILKKTVTREDLDWAKSMWIRVVQEDCFPLELKQLGADKEDKASYKQTELSKRSRLFTLSPVLVDGIIVLGGRIRDASVSSVVKNPPILDPNHQYTKIMIDWFHRISGHFGQERVINELRQNVWILDCRAAVRKSWAKCAWCNKKKVKPIPPMMGQLPSARLDGQRPFQYTGVDLFGPYFVTVGRSHQKRWGIIFTCLTFRAVHLDVLDGLSTNDLMLAYTRFINIRGVPQEIWSDHGTNFIGAEKELKQAVKQWHVKDGPEKLGSKEITWKFIPPSSPHMGGAWERLVGCTKKILDNLLRERYPKETVLKTLFTEVMAILNGRPLTRASPDPDDLGCLTPNHFLISRTNIGPSIPGEFSDEDKFTKSWRMVQFMANQFWVRFQREYIPMLSKRQKWYQETKPLQVDDIVLVVDDCAPRNMWKLGRIVSTNFSKDGQVRSATVKITSVDPDDPKKKVKVSILERPSVKMCLISKASKGG